MHFDFPRMLRITEHYIRQLEIEHIYVKNYELVAKYCRQTLENGWVSTIVLQNLKFSNINIEDYFKVQTTEACANNLESAFLNICIRTLFRVYIFKYLYTDFILSLHS
jgi:hypothetical protein